MHYEAVTLFIIFQNINCHQLAAAMFCKLLPFPINCQITYPLAIDNALFIMQNILQYFP